MVGPRYIVGELIGYALIYSGIARWFLNRRIAGGEVTAFFLHDPDKQVFAKVMTTARRWGFEFVNDQQLLDHLNGEKVSERPLLHISVDDGWRNNLTNVAEFAEQNNIPVTYFISTEPMEAGDFWWNRVEDAKTVHQLMNSQNAERLQYLQKHAAQTATRRLAMTADDVARLAKMRHATIGNHTHSHPILGTCTNEEIEFEISEAHRRLTGLLGTNLISFAYPSGSMHGHEHQVLSELGYRIAYSVEPRGVRRDEQGRFDIPRFADNMHAGYAENFCRLIGLWQTMYLLFSRKPAVYSAPDTLHADAVRTQPRKLAASPMAILQFIPEPTETFRADVVALFGRYLPRQQVNCTVVGSKGQHEAVQATKGGLSVVDKIRKKLRLIASYWGVWFGWMVKASKRDWEVIQVRDMAVVATMTVLWAKIKGIPFCYWSSFLMCEQRIIKAHAELKTHKNLKNIYMLIRGRFEAFLLYWIVFPLADHIFVQSDAMAAHYASRGVAAQKMTAVPMGVDMEQLNLDELKSDRSARWGNDPVIAYLGTLNSERGVQNLIDALVQVRKSVPNARLALIGSSERKGENDQLLRHAASLDLADQVEITGWLPSRDAWKLLLNADVAVSFFPRSLVFDTCTPTKCLEYLAAQIPCVANDNPDQVQVLTESNAGWLVRNDDADMVDALVEVLRDPKASRERAARGPAYIASARSYSVIAEMVAREYRRIAVRGNVQT